MNNHRQLTYAWLLHAHDQNDTFAYASPAGFNYDPDAWMSGVLDFAPNNTSNWDLTRDVQRSPLWEYCGKVATIFRCPSDRSTVRPSSGPFKDQVVPRVRSMSMNLWLGAFAGSVSQLGLPGFQSPPWQVYLRLSDLVSPGPSMTMAFLDQREDSINFGNYAIDMRGYPDRPDRLQFWQDMPASYHNRAGGLSFADGHSEIRRWRDARTMPPLRSGVNWLVAANEIPSPNNVDISWLQERATRRK